MKITTLTFLHYIEYKAECQRFGHPPSFSFYQYWERCGAWFTEGR